RGRDWRGPGRCYRVAGAGGPGAAVLAGAEHQPRCGNRGLSASGRRLRRGLFARLVGAVPSYGPSALLPSRNPLTGRLSALYVGDERENRPLRWSDRTGWRAGVPTTAVPAGPLSRLCSYPPIHRVSRRIGALSSPPWGWLALPLISVNRRAPSQRPPWMSGTESASRMRLVGEVCASPVGNRLLDCTNAEG